MTKSMTPGTSASESTTTPANTWNGATENAPWQAPELESNPECTLDLLRETKHMINSLQEREKKYKAEIQKMHEAGELAPLVDEENSNRYNGHGVSVTLVPGKRKRTWDPSVQEEIDQLQKQIKKIEAMAEYHRQYTEQQGPSTWRVTLEREL